MQDSGELGRLRDSWFAFFSDPCDNRNPSAASSGTLGFYNFSGLWIILGATVFFAIFLSMLTFASRRLRGLRHVWAFITQVTHVWMKLVPM